MSELMTGPGRSGPTRRQILASGAVVGGTAWTVPTILGSSVAGAQTVSPAPDPGPRLIDTVLVDTSTRDAVSSSVSLVAGTTYRLRGSGTTTNGGNFPNFDVEYAFNTTTPLDTGGSEDYGVKFAGQGPGLKDPRWGPYEATTHTYEVLHTPSTTGPVSFFFDDSFYADNSGVLTVQIFTT